MNKLFIFQKKSPAEYKSELSQGYRLCLGQTRRMMLNDFSINKLVAAGIDVVISNGLPPKYYYILRGMHIVTITIDTLDPYVDLADIVIDYKSSNNVRYFTGPDCSIRQNKAMNFKEIVNLVSKLEWDSRFWGYPVAYVSCRHLTENILYRMEKVIKRERIKLIEYLCNCHDNHSVILAEQNGFHFTDIRLSFEKILNSISPAAIPQGFTFGKAVTRDIDRLKKISKNIYKDSRYNFDQNFDRGKTVQFYQEWVEKAVRGTFDDICYCLFKKDVPVGFCTIKYRADKNATIGLFGIHKEYTGKGLSKVFLKSVLNQLAFDGFQKVSVVTQGRNYLAQRLYQRLGFLTRGTELWYHRWF